MTSPRPGPVRLTGGRSNSGRSEPATALKVVVRDLLGLDADHTVVVKELACSEPGCPPTETVIAVWPPTGRARKWTLHRPLADVSPDDIRLALGVPDEPVRRLQEEDR